MRLIWSNEPTIDLLNRDRASPRGTKNVPRLPGITPQRTSDRRRNQPSTAAGAWIDVATPRRYTLRRMKSATSRKSRIDRKRVGALPDEKIDFSDIPELTPEMFARAVVRRGLKPVARKRLLTIRIDSDVLEWYRRQGPGYQTRITALLRAYMQAHPRKRAATSRNRRAS